MKIVKASFEILPQSKHFFELRTPATAHPQARELAIPLQKEMNKIK